MIGINKVSSSLVIATMLSSGCLYMSSIVCDDHDYEIDYVYTQKVNTDSCEKIYQKEYESCKDTYKKGQVYLSNNQQDIEILLQEITEIISSQYSIYGDIFNNSLKDAISADYLAEDDIELNYISLLGLKNILLMDNNFLTRDSLFSVDEDGNLTIEKGDENDFFFVRFLDENNVFFNILKKFNKNRKIDIVAEGNLVYLFEEIEKYAA